MQSLSFYDLLSKFVNKTVNGHISLQQRLRRVCANMHSLLTVTHIKLGVDQVQASPLYVEWMNFMSHNSNNNVGKGPFVSANLLCKFTLLFNPVVYMAFF